ncbi:MAG: phosphatase PAP2 family protein [Rhodobiaceae bacterium]|nr:phosphatase PAP2 family protein [Rhodobiaceae bacterium]
MFVVRHLRGLWGDFWLLPLAPLAFIAGFAALGDLRVEHVVIVAIIVALGAGTEKTKGLLIACLPGVGIGLGYEAIRYLRPFFVTPERVLGCELRAVELRLAGLGPDTTLADYFTLHHSAAADLVFALPYTVFWMVAIIYGLALYFLNPARASRFIWVLALSHAVAFVIWLWLPAAPPWYVRSHGCAIDINALPDAAALARVDAQLAISYFHDFYSRSPNVFGALPSLHLAFPTAMLVTAWRGTNWGIRALLLAYVLWMLAASVYLDHHWLVDGLLGIAIVLAVDFVLARLRARRLTKAVTA